jgi:hypothetical protein
MRKNRKAGFLAATALLCLFATGLVCAAAQNPPANANAPAKAGPPAKQAESSATTPPSAPEEQKQAPIPGDWPIELLYDVWNSPNPQAAEALYAAAFAAGPAVIPDLQAALKDDRTAELAAQSLAFIGGNRSLEILSKLMNDPRDLGLKRFFYGALAEMDSPEATGILLDAIAHSDAEPDRTITEAAILALTVRSDPTLIPKLKALESKVQDPVVQDDLENAADVISARAKYLALPANQNADYSLQRAVRTYFIPALEPPPPPRQTGAPVPAPGSAAKPHSGDPASPPVTVKIDHLTFSPDQKRALARVTFEVPSARAHYDMVLQKRAGNWRLASVWLGTEEETPISQ